jgi:hypothetical protein
MTVERIELLVEEPSMEAALRLLLPKMIGSQSFEIYSHQGKSDLLARLPQRLRGYASWLPPSWRIVVLVDRDDDDCTKLKARLEKIATEAGLKTRTTSKGKTYVVVNRMAIEELEAWYFGDWEAVNAAYPRTSLRTSSQATYRKADLIKGGTWEAFERVLQRAGYFKGGLRKIEAARMIAAHMNPERNRSPSFIALRNVILEMKNA